MPGLILYLVRHGETADNARNVFQGQGGVGLNRLGRAQAARLAARMSRAPPTAIVASDLERAAETARIVGQACAVPVELEPRLREIDVGRWSGKSYEDVEALYPDEWSAWARGEDVRRGGGETYAELAERVDRALASIGDRFQPGERVLVVSHGGSIKSWVSKLLALGAEGRLALGGVANAGMTAAERDARGRTRIHSWNDTAHLEGLIAAEHED